MKKFLSIILVGLLMLGSVNVFATDTADYTAELKKYGIIKGDPDGNMRLADTLTRAEAVTLLVRVCGFAPEISDAAPANKFSDMEGHWACNAAMIAKGLRIVNKMDGEAFNPDENIPAEEFIKMVICLLGYRDVAEQKNAGPHGYIIQASQLGVTRGVPMALGNYITRENAVQILYNSLDVPVMVMTSFNIKEGNEYTIMNGKNGNEYRSLRTMLEVE